MILFWVGVAIVALIVEVITPLALVSIWFTAGAVIALLLAFMHVDVIVQAVAFFAVSLVTLLTIRPVATRYLRGNVVATNADRMINADGVVLVAIKENAWGEVKVMGSVWSAVTRDGSSIEEGARVRIIAIEGAKLIVRPIEL